MATTPLEREILTHYATTAGPYRGGSANWTETHARIVERFIDLGLLIAFKGADGAKVALPIWIDFMKVVLPSTEKETFKVPDGMEWAEYASHSHNGYIDTALSMGLPGLALLIGVLVIAPLRNFHHADRGGNQGPLAMMLLQIWLFGLYLSSLESFFLDRADPMWFTFLVAVFGLHYLARFRITA